MEQGNVCLLIIFNHRYDKNIDVLDRIYRGRFKAIYYIVPFYDGTRKDVIPVYESSYQFSGYVAQAKYFIKEKYSHYLFIADDLLLNPYITERNYCEWFHIGEKDAFISNATAIGDMKMWGFEARSLNAFDSFTRYTGVNWENEIMKDKIAFQIMEKKGYTNFYIDMDHFSHEKIRKKIGLVGKFPKTIFRFLRQRGLLLPYPVLGGYSDIFIVLECHMDKFAHYCGVFAAIRLFVEMSIPTALMLTCDKVVTLSETDKVMKIMWTDDEKKEFEESNSYSIDKLLNSSDTNCVCYHPVKLSRWRF